MNALTIPVTLASNLMLAACILPFASAAPSEAGTVPVPRSGPCDLPTTRDLIIWQRAPRLQDSAFEVGDADLLHCKPTLDTWASEQPTGPGYCSKISLPFHYRTPDGSALRFQRRPLQASRCK